MATAIKAIPTLYGEDAIRFREEMEANERAFLAREPKDRDKDPFIIEMRKMLERSGLRWKLAISKCRLAIVDAKNSKNVISFYEKNGFKCLFNTEADEYKYMHMHEKEKETEVAEELKTRLMYCDLLAE